MPGHTSTYVDVTDFTIQYHTSIPLVSSTYHSYRVKARIENALVLFRGVVVYWKRQVSPAPGVATFADVPVGSFGFKHVEALSASGITAGCGGGNFCPDRVITRVEMAVFLAKALGLHFEY